MPTTWRRRAEGIERATTRGAGANVFAAGVTALATLIAAPAAASDGAYGRFDGDLELGAGAGIAFQAGGPSFTTAATATYLSTAGIAARYGDSFGRAAALEARSFALAVAIRPLFLGRWANNLEQGPATLDLLLDSLTLDVGAFARQPLAAREAPSAGLRWGLETGVEVAAPLTRTATGLFLVARGALRFAPSDAARAEPRPLYAGTEPPPLVDTRALFTLTLAYRAIVAAHLVDAGDRLER